MTTYKQIPTTLSNLKLDGRNTNNKSETLNIITTTQRDAIPTANLVDGMQIYNSTLGLFQGRVGSAWTNFMTGGLGAFTAPSLATAPVTGVAGMIYEDTVTNQLTAYNGTAWGALYRTTNLTGTFGLTAVANTGALPASPANGTMVYQTDIGGVKYYNGVWNIISETTDVNGYITMATGAGTPTGTAPFNAQAHTVGTLYFDSVTPKIWVCSVAGTPGTWVGVAVS